MKKYLVAGATGKLGQLVVRELQRRNQWVRVLSRTNTWPETFGEPPDDLKSGDITSPDSIRAVCQDIDVVVSCAGASMNIKMLSDRSTFTEVDFNGNVNLLHAAQSSRVKKFIYVSAAGAEQFNQYEYFGAHWRFEETLAASGMDHAVVQPSGFFYFMGEILNMAKKGKGFLIGDGSSKTNPVHEQDVAEACVDAVEGAGRYIAVGGPEVFTRREIAELAFSAIGRTPSILSIPRPVFSLLVWPMKIINPRIHALLELGAVVSTTDAVIPSYGKRRLTEYFQSLLQRSS